MEVSQRSHSVDRSINQSIHQYINKLKGKTLKPERNTVIDRVALNFFSLLGDQALIVNLT